MKNAALKNWLEKQTDRIAEDALRLKPDFFPETVHGFRTGTKRLRAVLRLAGSDEDKLPAAFRKLYHAAGVLRDNHVLLQRVIEEQQVLPTFAIWLSYRIGAASYKLSHMHSHSALHELKEFVERYDKMPDESRITLFFSVRLDCLDESLKSPGSDETIHEMRKANKDMQYALAFLKKVWPEEYQKWAVLEDKLDAVSESGGAYNDHRTMLDALVEYKQVCEQELTEVENTATSHAEQNWQKAKTLLRKDMFAAVDAVIAPELLHRLPLRRT